jgi:hypothetical protein
MRQSTGQQAAVILRLLPVRLSAAVSKELQLQAVPGYMQAVCSPLQANRR